MTRINLIEPKHLTDRHLVAEYKETTQFLWCVKARADKGQDLVDMPKNYTLNKGHCLFFYDKGKYLHDRFISLKEEMDFRGINYNKELFGERRQKILDAYPQKWFNDYTPDTDAYRLVINRIGTRINQKPHLYPDADRFFNNVNNYGVQYEQDAELETYHKS